jgi:hypothetical protein
MDRCKYQHDLTLIPTRKDGPGARGHWLARYPRESNKRVGVIAGGVMATAMLLGLSIAPTAHADDLLATLEADALSYLPLNVQELALSALGDTIPSTEVMYLADAHSYLTQTDGDFLVAVLSSTEFGPEVSDSLALIGDVEGAISDISSVASDGINIAGLTLAAAAFGAAP